MIDAPKVNVKFSEHTLNAQSVLNQRELILKHFVNQLNLIKAGFFF